MAHFSRPVNWWTKSGLNSSGNWSHCKQWHIMYYLKFIYIYTYTYHGNPQPSLFRGYDPYILGLRPSLFIVWGSKGMLFTMFFYKWCTAKLQVQTLDVGCGISGQKWWLLELPSPRIAMISKTILPIFFLASIEVLRKRRTFWTFRWNQKAVVGN